MYVVILLKIKVPQGFLEQCHRTEVTSPPPGYLPSCKFHFEPKSNTPLSAAKGLLKAMIRCIRQGWSLQEDHGIISKIAISSLLKEYLVSSACTCDLMLMLLGEN